jgi:TusA-related sulfurtransferase
MSHKKKEKMFLDITKDSCPITFVKTKIALEKLKIGQSLEVHITAGEALEGLPNSLKELGYIITKKKQITNSSFSLKIIHLNKDTLA